MKRTPKTSTRRILPVLLPLLAGGCSDLLPDGTDIRVENETGGPVTFLAMEREMTHRFDPAPSYHIDPADERILPDGGSRRIPPEEIPGPFRFGDDLRFFLYEVVADTAYLRTILTRTASQLRGSGFRVVFEAF